MNRQIAPAAVPPSIPIQPPCEIDGCLEPGVMGFHEMAGVKLLREHWRCIGHIPGYGEQPLAVIAAPPAPPAERPTLQLDLFQGSKR